VNESYGIANVADNQVIIVNHLINKLALSESLEESAKKYRALVRRRIVKSATDLLVSLFMYAVSGMSLRLLATSTSAMGIANMTDQAWQKRIVLCEPWLASILSDVMHKLPSKKRKLFCGRTVKLIDGSMFVQAGNKDKKGGKSIRVHICYNLTEGVMDSILLTDDRTAESVSIVNINSNDIVIGDAGYGKGKSLVHVLSLKADAIFRASPNLLNLAHDAQGKLKLNMIKKLTGAKDDVLDFSCFVHSENRKYHKVRVIASRLPEDKALLAKKRKKRRASKRQQQIKEETLIFAEWIVLITSLSYDFSAERILEMYRARWQIELLFKRIKQSFKVQKLQPATLEHSTVMVLLWLILWALTEKQSVAIEMFLIEKDENMNRYSPWATQSFILLQLKAFINSMWLYCLSYSGDSLQLFRRLLNHHSSRRNDYALFS